MLTMVEGAVEDGASELFILQDLAPMLEGFIGGEEGGFTLEIATINDLEENVSCTGTITEIAHLINDQDVGQKERLEGEGEVMGDSQIVDQGRRRGEPCDIAVLDRLVGNGNTKVGFAGPRRAFENE